MWTSFLEDISTKNWPLSYRWFCAIYIEKYHYDETWLLLHRTTSTANLINLPSAEDSILDSEKKLDWKYWMIFFLFFFFTLIRVLNWKSNIKWNTIQTSKTYKWQLNIVCIYAFKFATEKNIEILFIVDHFLYLTTLTKFLFIINAYFPKNWTSLQNS